MVQRAILSLAGSIFCLFAFVANAAVVDDLGPLSIGDSAGFSNTGIVGPVSFTDDFTFTLNTDASVVSAAASVELENFFGIDPFTMLILNSTETMTFGSDGGVGATSALLQLSLNAGDYILRITGTVASGELGAYAGQLTAVPLPPAAYLLGSVLVGLVAFGRMQRKSAKSAAV